MRSRNLSVRPNIQHKHIGSNRGALIVGPGGEDETDKTVVQEATPTIIATRYVKGGRRRMGMH